VRSVFLHSAAVNQFLSVTLGVGGLKRLTKSMDAAFTAIQSTLLDRLQPALEHLLFHVCELQGLTAWPERAEPIGLQIVAAQSCQSAAEGALTASAQAAHACSDAACSFRNMFLWLQRCQRRCVLTLPCAMR
jgi:anaphase-promoting complex subunit 4